MNEFHCGTRLICGPDALQVLKTLKAERVLLVTDPFFAKNGTADRIAALCNGTTEVFPRYSPIPALPWLPREWSRCKSYPPICFWRWVAAVPWIAPRGCSLSAEARPNL